MAKETAAKETLKRFEARQLPRPQTEKSWLVMLVDLLVYSVIYVMGMAIVIGFLLLMLLLIYIGLAWSFTTIVG